MTSSLLSSLSSSRSTRTPNNVNRLFASVPLLLLFVSIVILVIVPPQTAHALTLLTLNDKANYVVTDTTYTDEIWMMSPTNSKITFGPRVTFKQNVIVFVTQNTEFTFNDVTVDGTIFFAGIADNTTMKLEGSTFRKPVSIGPISKANQFRFAFNTMSISSGDATLLEFSGAVNSTSFEIESNTLSLTSTASLATCFQIGSAGDSYLQGTNWSVWNNTCILVGTSTTYGFYFRGSVDITDRLVVDSNTINPLATGGSSQCIAFVDFQNANTTGFFVTNNNCVSLGTDIAKAIEINTQAVTSTWNVTAPIINISGNTLSSTASGSTGSATCIDVGYILRSNVVSLISGNSLTANGNRGTAGILLSKGVASSSYLDIVSNTFSLTNANVGTSDTPPGALRIVQTTAAATSVSVLFWKNSITLNGNYFPGYVAVRTQSVTGYWTFSNNTLGHASNLQPHLYSPSLDVASPNTGDVSISCNFFTNGTAVTSPWARLSLLNGPSWMPLETPCGSCNYTSMCNQETSFQVVRLGGECKCRCNYERTRFDTFPRHSQCSGRAGMPYTNTPTVSFTATRTESDSPSKTLSESLSSSQTLSRSASMSATASESRSKTESASRSHTVSMSSSLSSSDSKTASVSKSVSKTLTLTLPPTPSRTSSKTQSGPTESSSDTKSLTPSNSASPTTSRTRTQTRTDSKTKSFSRSKTVTISYVAPTYHAVFELQPAEIAGIAVGGFIFLLLLLLLIWWCCCRDGEGGEEGEGEGHKSRGGIADEDGELDPMEPVRLPCISTMTDKIAEREDAAHGHFAELSSFPDPVHGELVPSRPANPFMIMALPSEPQELTEEEMKQIEKEQKEARALEDKEQRRVQKEYPKLLQQVRKSNHLEDFETEQQQQDDDNQQDEDEEDDDDFYDDQQQPEQIDRDDDLETSTEAASASAATSSPHNNNNNNHHRSHNHNSQQQGQTSTPRNQRHVVPSFSSSSSSSTPSTNHNRGSSSPSSSSPSKKKKFSTSKKVVEGMTSPPMSPSEKQ